MVVGGPYGAARDPEGTSSLKACIVGLPAIFLTLIKSLSLGRKDNTVGRMLALHMVKPMRFDSQYHTDSPQSPPGVVPESRARRKF